MKRIFAVALGVALVMAVAASAEAQVVNGGFEDNGATGTSGVGIGNMGNAANGWDVWNNTLTSTVTSEASPSTDPFAPGGGAHMFHIVTGGADDGLYQFPGGFGLVSADFYVVSGAANLLTAFAGSIMTVNSTTALGAWQHLTTNFNGANEVALYSSGGAADFYVDNVVTGAFVPGQPTYSIITFSGGAAPEPASWALMILGFGMAGGLLRRRLPAGSIA